MLLGMILLRGSGVVRLDELSVTIQDGSRGSRLIEDIGMTIPWHTMVLRLQRPDGTSQDVTVDADTIIQTAAGRWRVCSPVITPVFADWAVGFAAAAD